MCRICCLHKGETRRTLHKEVLYRRFLRFYITFHLLFFISTIIETEFYLHEFFIPLYISSAIFLFIDLLSLITLLLRPNIGPHKSCIYFALANSIPTLAIYCISRLAAFFDPKISPIYDGFITIAILVFLAIKCRCIYHIWRFNRFNAFEKHTKGLSLLAPVEISDSLEIFDCAPVLGDIYESPPILPLPITTNSITPSDRANHLSTNYSHSELEMKIQNVSQMSDKTIVDGNEINEETDAETVGKNILNVDLYEDTSDGVDNTLDLEDYKKTRLESFAAVCDEFSPPEMPESSILHSSEM